MAIITGQTSITFFSIDIHECELETDNCHVNANCTDTIGSFECSCNSGFEGDGVNCTSELESLLLVYEV